MRFLAIIQVKPKSGDSACEEVVYNEQSQTYAVNGWNIRAEMDAFQPALIEVYDNEKTASFISVGSFEFEGKDYEGKVTGSSKLVEIIDNEHVFQEVVDEVPAAIKRAMSK